MPKTYCTRAQVVASIPAALDGCYSAIATTARPRDINTPLEPPDQALPALLNQPIENPLKQPSAHQTNQALIFGPEDRGLSNEELIHAQRFVKIPTDDYSALNLAQAVAVCCYELHRASLTSATPSPALRNSADGNDTDSAQNLTNALRTSPLSGKQTESNSLNDLLNEQVLSPVPHPAKLNELEGYYQHLESVLLSVEYLYPHTAASRMRKIRQLLQKATPTSAEIALLRGMLRQVEWALSESKQG